MRKRERVRSELSDRSHPPRTRTRTRSRTSSTEPPTPNPQLQTFAFTWLARGGVLLILLIVGWSAGSAMRSRHSQDWPPRDKRVRVLTTIFPIFDFARQVGGENVVVRNLLPPGVDPHEFALSPRD